MVVVVDGDVAVTGVKGALNECSERDEAYVAACLGRARGSWVENSCRVGACNIKRNGGNVQSVSCRRWLW